jgi:hypothetical protein
MAEWQFVIPELNLRQGFRVVLKNLCEICPVQRALQPQNSLQLFKLETTTCGSGGIGRRARFRISCPLGVGVRVPPSAFFYGSVNWSEDPDENLSSGELSSPSQAGEIPTVKHEAD